MLVYRGVSGISFFDRFDIWVRVERRVWVWINSAWSPSFDVSFFHVLCFTASYFLTSQVLSS